MYNIRLSVCCHDLNLWSSVASSTEELLTMILTMNALSPPVSPPPQNHTLPPLSWQKSTAKLNENISGDKQVWTCTHTLYVSPARVNNNNRQCGSGWERPKTCSHVSTASPLTNRSHGHWSHGSASRHCPSRLSLWQPEETGGGGRECFQSQCAACPRARGGTREFEEFCEGSASYLCSVSGRRRAQDNTGRVIFLNCGTLQ